MQYFAMTLLSRTRATSPSIHYASDLIAGIAQEDAMLCSELCAHVDELLRSPSDICRLLNARCDEQHVQTSLRNTQLRQVLPLVEQKRLGFIEHLNGRASRLLPFSDDWGNQIESTAEIELRHLVYFRRSGRLLLTGAEDAYLMRLYDIRNRLSHLRVIPYDAISCIQEEPLPAGQSVEPRLEKRQVQG